MRHTLQDLTDEYEAHFTAVPADLAKPRTAVLWTRFASECDVDLERLMRKVAELRGKSRARPALSDLQDALSAIRNNDGIRRHAALPCGLCISGYIEVLFWVDADGRAVLGHSGNTSRLYRTLVMCSCSRGHQIAEEQGVPPDRERAWLDAHLAIKKDARDLGLSLGIFIDGLVRDSVCQFGPKIGSPLTRRMAALRREVRFADA
jgi:hypothetical protein